jgi:hypothetical protein
VANLHPSLRQPCRVIQLPILPPATDVGVESFQHDGQRPLHDAFAAIDAVRAKGGRVLVCCQQGKDRSALVVLAYLRAKYGVTADAACVHTTAERTILSQYRGGSRPYCRVPSFMQCSWPKTVRARWVCSPTVLCCLASPPNCMAVKQSDSFLV